jgi:hypothetical protein
LDLDHRVAALVNNLEWPGLDILLDSGVIVAATDEAPVSCQRTRIAYLIVEIYLTSKTVFSGFIAAWFLAASPMRRSSSVKETNEGVVKLPCSLATVRN